ncbi:lectin c-type domain-containing protein [Ditylenchus destructor]|nr:lectin c-type domain-containing protein [Ditylenchus destructor]
MLSFFNAFPIKGSLAMPPALPSLFVVMDYFLLLVISVLITYSATTEICSNFEGPCADGWHYYAGNDEKIRCFKVFIDKSMTFHEAEGVCSQIMSCFHSQLASFHSKDEYDFIVRLQAEAIPVRSKRHSWIGMQHSGRPKPEVPDKTAKNRFELRFEDHTPMFNFTYMDDRQYAHYWGFNGSGSSTHGWEPNGDRITQHSDVERCVEIGTYVISQTNSTYGVMNDNDCEKKFTYICEFIPTNTTTTTTTTTTPSTTTSTTTTTTTTPTTTTTTPATTSITTTEPTTTTASSTTTMTTWPTTPNPTTTIAYYNVAPPYQIWPPPQSAEYMQVPSIANQPSYAIAQPIPPQPRYEYVHPMNNWYDSRYTFPNANGQNDFYHKALLAAFDDDLDPIDLFSN